MSVNDQADGFYEMEPAEYHCPHCVGLPSCACTHPHEGFMGPIHGHERTVSELSTMPYGMRLARGFAILSGNKHDL
jgi:hypothetical protein